LVLELNRLNPCSESTNDLLDSNAPKRYERTIRKTGLERHVVPGWNIALSVVNFFDNVESSTLFTENVGNIKEKNVRDADEIAGEAICALTE
jgi:hypothetical protein